MQFSRVLFGVGIVFALSIAHLSFAYIGPTSQNNPPPTGGGAIGVDANYNLSVGTSTPLSTTKLYIVAPNNLSSNYGFRINAQNGSTPYFFVTNDGRVSINTSTVSSTLTVGGDLTVGGTIYGNLAAGGTILGTVPAENISSGVFGANVASGTPPYAFRGNLGIGTSTQVGLPQVLSVYGGGYVSGNFGVGTTSPQVALDVNGTMRGTGFQLTTGAQSGYVLTSNVSGVGTWQSPPSAQDPRWISSGTAMYATTTITNLGIGTNAPTYRLDVNASSTNSVRIRTNNSGGTQFLISDDHLTLQNTIDQNNYPYIEWLGHDGQRGAYLGWGNPPAVADKYLDFTFNAGTNLHIRDNDGNSGRVGINTPLPQAKLHVADDIGAAEIARFSNTLAGNATPYVSFRATNETERLRVGGFSNGIAGYGLHLIDTVGPLSLVTSNTPRFFIQPSGLTTINAPDTGTKSTALIMYGGLSIERADPIGGTAAISISHNSDTDLSAVPFLKWEFRDITFGDTYGTEGVITGAGYLGLGTSTPSQRLHVNGGMRITPYGGKPLCNSATNRGTIWFTQGGTGVKDSFEVCAKDASNNYAWRTIY